MSTWDIIAALMGAAVALDVGANVAVNPRIDDPTRLATADYFDTRSLVSGFPALSGDSAMVAIARTAGDGHTDPTLHLDLVNRATGRVARTSVVARPPRRIDGAIDSVIVAVVADRKLTH